MTTPELDALLERGLLNGVLAELLPAAVRARLNVIISGPGDSARTSLLRALGCAVPARERLATMEMVPQLNLSSCGRSVLELSGPTAAFMLPTIQAHSIHRLLLDDADSDTTLPLLQAMSSGGSGSMGTVEAASPHEALQVLTGWTALALGSAAAATRLVRDAVDLVVQLSRTNAPAGGRRFCSHLHEVDRTQPTGQEITLRAVFRPVPGQPRAVFQTLPACIDQLERHGFDRAVLADASHAWGPW
ncbi:hypothetical protein [Streptomyces violascens]|uniref:hypothetical protein n=1 Tax=Streptomyces violascens TaxID=67381 RepID=UPI003684DA25